MRTHDRPIPLTQALRWAEQKNLQHLFFVVVTDVNSTLKGFSLKVGSAARCSGIQNEHKALKTEVMTYAQAKRYNEAGTTSTAETTTKTPADVTTEWVGDNLEDDDKEDKAPEPTTIKPVEAMKTETASSIATALEEMIRNAAAGSLDEKKVRQIASDTATSVASAIVTKALENAFTPTLVKVENTTAGEVKDLGLQHYKFPLLLNTCGARLNDGHRMNVWLVGPAGAGKTSAASNVAKAMDLPFYFNGAIDTKYELFGFIDATGKATMTPFRQAWTNGGVYLFDEVDGSDAGAVVAFNGALANGHAPFPDATIPRHPDCIIIAGANTSGHGATTDYNGRNKMDAAFLDRFVVIEWPIDESLERAMTGNDQWYGIVKATRAKAATAGLRGYMVTPRASVYGAALLKQGLPLDTVKELTLRKGLSDADWAKVR